jgi:hypothetical protein
MVLEALRQGAQKALRISKALGHPVPACVDGKVVWIPPESIPVDQVAPPNMKAG